jgi:transposase
MNREDILVMSQEELKRLELVKKALSKELKQVEVSELLGISYRQVKRIVKRVRELGSKGVIHQLRGKVNSRKFPDEYRQKVIGFYLRRYKGFGASLAREKLAKHEGIRVNRETLRHWLVEEGCLTKRRIRRKHRQRRERKEYCGQMVQMDGSHHDWLEERGPRIVLMGYIDDASNRIFGRFYEYEGTIPALDSFKRYCLKYGIPQSVYLDKHTTYKSNSQEQWKLKVLGQGDGLSAFERSLKMLKVEVIHANSPQAKGRIERLFRTLQDRLVKELRLAKAKTIEEANEVLDGYLIEHNSRYMVKPVKQANLHRKSLKARELNEILSIRKEHVIRNDFTVAHEGQLYQVLKWTSAKKVQVREYVDGQLAIIGNNNNRLKYKLIDKRPEEQKPRVLAKPGHVSKRYRVKWLVGNWASYNRTGRMAANLT